MYLVDLRRGRVGLVPFDRYALYICFFPQLIAGPLTRWNQVMHQFGREMLRPGWEQRFVAGLVLIVIGLIEKVFLGDQLARVIGPVFESARAGIVSDGSAWLALGFAFQVFFDFAGYSDIAIGLGLLFGIELPQNFNAPFRAKSIQEFWQRWHMTLTLFLRDYVFLPLCDVRVWGRRHVLAAMFATMTLCGLWHGAGWNYVIWGALHGAALVLATRWPPHAMLPLPVRRAATIAFVLTTAIFFGWAGSDQAPSRALVSAGGGRLAADPRDPQGRKTLERIFEIDVALERPIGLHAYGQRVFVRFDLQPAPLAVQWYGSLRRLFLRHFSV